MRCNDPSGQPFSGSVIGNTSDPTTATTAQFGAFWGELATRFPGNEKVIFGLTNEPHGMGSALLQDNLQTAIDAIRGAGAKNLILAPGNAWSGGHSRMQGGSEANINWMQGLVDAEGNTAIDVHEYLNEDCSGGHAAYAGPGGQPRGHDGLAAGPQAQGVCFRIWGVQHDRVRRHAQRDP
jgi:endoglucanase